MSDTGEETVATTPEVEPAVESALLHVVSAANSWYYCLESRHPGAREVIDDSRFFQSDEYVPVCPACGKQVAAVPVPDQGVYPSSLLALADRLL